MVDGAGDTDKAMGPKDVPVKLRPLICVVCKLWECGFEVALDTDHDEPHPAIVLRGRDRRGLDVCLTICFSGLAGEQSSWVDIGNRGLLIDAWRPLLARTETSLAFGECWESVWTVIAGARFPLPATFYAEAGMLFGGKMPRATA